MTEFEKLVTDQLELIQGGLAAMESGLNNVFTHLIKKEQAEHLVNERMAKIEDTLEEIKGALRSHMDSEDERLKRLEEALDVSRDTRPPANGGVEP